MSRNLADPLVTLVSVFAGTPEGVLHTNEWFPSSFPIWCIFFLSLVPLPWREPQHTTEWTWAGPRSLLTVGSVPVPSIRLESPLLVLVCFVFFVLFCFTMKGAWVFCGFFCQTLFLHQLR